MAIKVVIMAASVFLTVAAAGAQAPAGSARPPHVSGGIGDTEQAALAAREKEFNLKLVFSLNEGNYLADVGVVVSDAAGRTLIEHFAQGPIFLARLPAGQYSVTATYEGRAQSRVVRVDEKRLRTVNLRWPSDPGNDLPVSRWINRE